MNIIKTVVKEDRAALLVLNPETLVELLQLPSGCHIDSAVVPHDQPGVLYLRVRGAGWPIEAGMLLPQVHGTVTCYYADDGTVLRRVIDWGFPKKAQGEVMTETTETNASILSDDTQFRCTICGQVGTVGRCCGNDTREPLNDFARAEVAAEAKCLSASPCWIANRGLDTERFKKGEK